MRDANGDCKRTWSRPRHADLIRADARGHGGRIAARDHGRGSKIAPAYLIRTEFDRSVADRIGVRSVRHPGWQIARSRRTLNRLRRDDGKNGPATRRLRHGTGELRRHW